MATPFDTLRGFSYAHEMGEAGRQRGEKTYLNRLAGEAYGAAPDQRQPALARLVGADAQTGTAMASHLGQADEAKYKQMGQWANMIVNTPPEMHAQVWTSRVAPALRSMGLEVDDAWDPQNLPLAQKLAETWGSVGGDGQVTVRSSFVGEDGQMYSIMSDGSVKAQGVGADRKLQAFDVPDVGPQVVDLRNATARRVTPEGTGAPRSAPASAFAFTPAPGAENNPAAADFQNLPPDQQQVAARLLQQGQDFTIQGGRVVPAAMRGGQPMGQKPPTLDRVPLSQLGGGDGSPAWVRPSSQATGNAPPSGYRFTANGGLEFIPGGPADPANKPQAQDKPIPVGALRLQLDAEEALTGAEGVIAELDRIDQQLADGTLDLGFFSNLANKAKNFAGMSDEESRAFNAFTSTLERLRNESLRLNKGVQTEGDSVRAWNELIADINDGKNVRTQIERIQRYNRRAVELQQRKMQAVQQNYQGKAAADNPEDDIDALLAEFGN